MTGETQNQNLILGVEYDGQQGVQQFLTALSPVAGQVEELFSKMSASQGGSNLWAAKGRDIAEQMYRGLQGALAGFSDLAGSSFGEKVLANAGLTPAQLRQQRELASELTRMRDELQRTGSPAATKQNYSQAEVLGLRQEQAAAERTARAYEDLAARRTRAQQQLDRARNITASPDGKIEPSFSMLQGSAKQGVGWSEAAQLYARGAGFRLPEAPTTATGAPSEAAARKIVQNELDRSVTTLSRSVAAMDQQMRVYNSAPSPKTEQVKDAVTRAVAPTSQPGASRPVSKVQQEIIEQRALNVGQRTVAGNLGVSRYQVQRTDVDFATEIKNLREQLIAQARAGGTPQRAAAEQFGVTRYQVQKVDESYAAEIASIKEATAARLAEMQAIKAAVSSNISQHAQNRLGPGAGRSSFDFEPNAYLPFRNQDGELVSNRHSQAASRYIRTRPEEYERLFRLDPSATDERDLAATRSDALRMRILENARQQKALAANGYGIAPLSGGLTPQQLMGIPASQLAPTMLGRPMSRQQELDQVFSSKATQMTDSPILRALLGAESKWFAAGGSPAQRSTAYGLAANDSVGLSQVRAADGALSEFVAAVRETARQIRENALGSSGAVGARGRTLSPREAMYERLDRQNGTLPSQTQAAADQSALIQLARRTLPDTGASAAERAAGARAEYLQRNLAWLDPSVSRSDLRNRDGSMPREQTAAGADWWNAQLRAGRLPTRRVSEQSPELVRSGDSFGAGFSRGFGTSPDNDRPFAEMVGQTARVSLFYGAAYRGITMVTQALSTMTQETLAYEDSLTSLNVVTGRSRSENEDAANMLGATATDAGFKSSQGVALGAGALGLYGAASADRATQERTMQLSAEVATRMARVSGADPQATQTQLAGALRSMGWGIERLPELEDTISYISRQTGQAPTQLLGAVANISTLGSQAGFTPQMLAALTAQVGTTTGQNPDATAGQFRQLLSRNASEIAPKASQITGLDLSGMDLQEIFAAVSKLDLSTDQLNRFASLFGKGGSQQVATILTQQYGTIQNLAGSAQGAEGFGKDAFEKTMASFGNQLRQVGAEVGELGVKLVELGFVDWLALVVKAVGGVVQAGNGLLDILNMIPRPLRSVALVLGEVYAASLLMQRLGWTTAGAHAAGPVGRLGQVAGAIATNPGQAVVAGARGARGALNAPFQPGGAFRLSEEARLAQTGALGRVRGFTGLTNLGLLGVAGGVAGAGLLVKKGFELDGDAKAAVETARLALASADTAEALKEVAAQARDAAKGLEEQGLGGLKTGDVGNLIPAIMSSLLTGDDKKRLDDIDKQATARAAAMADAQASLEVADKSNTFQDFTSDGLTGTLSDLEKSGYSATERLTLLNKAMFDFSDTAKGAAGAVAVIQKSEFWGVGQAVGQKGVEAIASQRDLFQAQEDSEYYKWNPLFPGPGTSKAGKRAKKGVEAFTMSADEESAVREALSSATQDALTEVGSDGIIDKSDAAAIKRRALSTLKDKLGPEAWKEITDGGFEDVFNLTMNSMVQGVLDSFGGKATRENLGAYLQLAPTVAGARRDQVTQLSGSDSIGNRAYLADLENSKRESLNLMAASGQGASDEELRDLKLLDTNILVAKRAVLQDRLADIQSWADVQKSYLSNADVKGQLAIDQQALDQQFAAQMSQYAADMAAATPSATSGALGWSGLLNPNVDTSFIGQHTVQQNSIAQQKAAEALAVKQNRATAGVYGGNALGQAGVQVSNAGLALNALAKDLGDDKDSSSAYWAAKASLNQAQYAYSQAQVQNANANALSKVDPRDNLGSLRTQMANVRREMSLLSPGQQGSQLEQLNQLNQQYEEALVSRSNAKASARIAGHSSGLEQARVGVRNAQRDLDLQLKGTEGYYSALGALRQAQASLAEQERSQADRVRRLHSDLTDPVEQARLDTQAALEKLAADKAAGDGRDTISQDKVDVKGARNRQEAAAFSQRISDLQVAEDLGRISHTQYMSYLQSEHDRLTAVANRTRQQQEELDQVDQLMKAAADQMQGQWNIGDIDLPTIYEVRRAVGSGAPTQTGDYSHSNNTVTVNGADFQAVVEWLQTALGTGAQVVTANTTRRS